MTETRRQTDRPSRLLALEAEEKRLCTRMNRDRVRRNEIQEELTRLRVSMTEAEADRYRRTKFREERL